MECLFLDSHQQLKLERLLSELSLLRLLLANSPLHHPGARQLSRSPCSVQQARLRVRLEGLRPQALLPLEGLSALLPLHLLLVFRAPVALDLGLQAVPHLPPAYLERLHQVHLVSSPRARSELQQDPLRQDLVVSKGAPRPLA